MLTAALPPAGPRFLAGIIVQSCAIRHSNKIILDIKHKSVQYVSNSRGNSYDQITY
jgi:hypothetical protein